MAIVSKTMFTQNPNNVSTCVYLIIGTFLFVVDEGESTLKNPSSLPCVLPLRAFDSFFMPLRIRSSLKHTENAIH